MCECRGTRPPRFNSKRATVSRSPVTYCRSADAFTASCPVDSGSWEKLYQGVLRAVIHVGQVDLWRSAGVEPDAALAISLGEIGAAYATGALTREETAAVITGVSFACDAMKDPSVMFVVYIGSILTTILWLQALFGQGEAPPAFILAVTLWLWVTLLFANFAEAIAEGRSKAQAASLKSARRETTAKKAFSLRF